MSETIPVRVQVLTVGVNKENGRPQGPAETLSMTADGKITEEGGIVTLRYKEAEGENVTFVRVTVEPDTVTVHRSGAAYADFRFDPSKKQTSVYKIPPYAFDVTIETLKMEKAITIAGGLIHLRYLMTIGGQEREMEMRLSVEVNDDVAI